MKLSDYFSSEEIVSDGVFLKTMFPSTGEKQSICYAATKKHLRIALNNPCISAIIANIGLSGADIPGNLGIVATEEPQKVYYNLHNYLINNNMMSLSSKHFVHPSAQIAETAVLGKHVIINKNVIIEDYAVVGDYTIIGEDSYIGERVVLGARGMQNLQIGGERFPVKYSGGVSIGKCCEILSGAIIQKPYQAFYTVIGNDTQISTQVVVGHGTKVGNHTMVAGSSQIAGNVKIGDQVWIGPGSTIADAISIADRAEVKIGSIVVQDVPAGSSVAGNFAISYRKHIREYIRKRREKI